MNIAKKSSSKKKSHKGLIITAVVIFVLLCIGGWFGLVPGFATLMGATHPRDLGVSATKEDLTSASAKLGRTREYMPATDVPAESLRFEGSHPVDSSFTQEEITANVKFRDYQYNPLSDNFQARFTDDEVEFSGQVIMKNLVPYALASDVPQDQIDAVMDKVSFIKVNPSFYLKGKTSVIDNRVDIDLEEAVIGNVKVPMSLVPKDRLESFTEDRLASIEGLDIESLTVEGGEVQFKGSYPDRSVYAR